MIIYTFRASARLHYNNYNNFILIFTFPQQSVTWCLRAPKKSVIPILSTRIRCCTNGFTPGKTTNDISYQFVGYRGVCADISCVGCILQKEEHIRKRDPVHQKKPLCLFTHFSVRNQWGQTSSDTIISGVKCQIDGFKRAPCPLLCFDSQSI